MNYLYLSKKINFFSSYLNLISSFGWISLVSLISYYHIWVLSDGNEYYKGFPLKNFILNPFINLRTRVPVSSVQSTHQYASSFIAQNGLGSFFSERGFWSFIQPIYLISIISSSLNLAFTLVSLFCFFKARDFNYLVSCLANLLLPVLGGLFSLRINGRLSNIGGPKSIKIVSPAQFLKLKARLLFSKCFREQLIPNY
ncbi:hypothetical protein OVS_00260 [Mycoplasma ovis str. Michigan]|uniref:Uncharacterized protein n=1 Tax=Mycoplasma ovis str. Michigan TaxID=1415773 RepID=A0ABM5P071_9MOLU|nr:hypothetical protein [Mycoplasma ovis]AHC39797.1 hypothetical protein OVS_00260 [Mycoplasma ovis str. Michigan]